MEEGGVKVEPRRVDTNWTGETFWKEDDGGKDVDSTRFDILYFFSGRDGELFCDR